MFLSGRSVKEGAEIWVQLRINYFKVIVRVLGVCVCVCVCARARVCVCVCMLCVCFDLFLFVYSCFSDCV